MVTYDRKFYVFGGAGSYISSIKMRNSFNDIQIFNTNTEKWEIEPDIDN